MKYNRSSLKLNIIQNQGELLTTLPEGEMMNGLQLAFTVDKRKKLQVDYLVDSQPQHDSCQPRHADP